MLMPRLRRIQIKNFRSIGKLDVRVEDLTVLVGDNDCGKSNILRALNLFFNGETNPGQQYKFQDDWNRFATTGAKQAKQIEIEVDLELPEGYRATNGDFIRWKKIWRQDGLHSDPSDYKGVRLVEKKRGTGQSEQDVEIPPKSNVHALLRKIEFEYVPAVRSADFFRKLRGRIFSVIAEVAEQGMRQTSGTFEAAIAGHVNELMADISKTLGDDARISMPNDLSVIFERLDFLSSEQAISLDNRGDGIKGRYIPLILKFLADQKRTLNTQGTAPYTFIWAYEEPENNLEFRRAQQLAAEFCDLADGDQTQVLLTTHSPVFYNLAEGNNSRQALHISLMDPVEGTKSEHPANAASSLDERMGVMSIVAPYVRKAEEKLSVLQARNSEIQGLLDRQDLPACFVEGASDYVVYRALLTAILPDWNSRLHLVQPPDNGAGAKYVADHLVSWHSMQKHRPTEARKKAFGIFDKDPAGDDAKKKIAELPSQNRLVMGLSLTKSPAVRAAAQNGLILPVAIEECYPLDWWVYAEKQGWLEDRERASILSDTTKSRVLNGETTFDQLTAGLEAELVIAKTVATGSKVTWAKWAAAKHQSELMEKLNHLSDLIREGLTFVGIEIPA
ncbi:MAG TPA: AAA family ATPase [Hyphomonas sp.]|nr:AAA family ATPase [Hyphomonas sp.]